MLVGCLALRALRDGVHGCWCVLMGGDERAGNLHVNQLELCIITYKSVLIFKFDVALQ